MDNISNSELQILADNNFGEYTHGEAHVVTTQDNEVVVIMNNKMFIAQRPTSSDLIAEFTSKNVSILNFSTSFLVFNHESQTGYFLKLSIDDRLEKIPQNIVVKLATSTSYGIGQRNSDYNDYFSNPSLVENSSINQLDASNPVARGCSSGGPGATSCKIGGEDDGCSVSCADGYYACCNDSVFMEPSCTCKQ